MSAITATELDLLTCFAVEPALEEPAKPWHDTRVTYTIEVAALSVTFAVHPSYRDIESTICRAGWPLYEVKAIGTADVRVLGFPGCDVFEIHLTWREWLRVQLRPRFRRTHEYERPRAWRGVADD
jgi:hypothetical protein